MDEDLTRAVVEAACRRLVLLAVACVDDGEPERLAEVYAPDAVLVRPGGDLLVGCDAIVAAYRSRPAGRLTRHLVTNTRVDVESPTSARARSHVLVWSGLEGDPVTADGRPAAGRQRVGGFDDRLRLTPQGWRIARRDAHFVFYKDYRPRRQKPDTPTGRVRRRQARRRKTLGTRVATSAVVGQRVRGTRPTCALGGEVDPADPFVTPEARAARLPFTPLRSRRRSRRPVLDLSRGSARPRRPDRPRSAARGRARAAPMPG